VPTFAAVVDRVLPVALAVLPGALAALAPVPLVAVAVTAGAAVGGAYGGARFLPGVPARAYWLLGLVTLAVSWGSLAVLGFWPPARAPGPVSTGLWAGSLAVGATAARAWLRRR
jgi:hypothetical protein